MPKDTKCGPEVDKIVSRAEQLWAAYKRRVAAAHPHLYGTSMAASTGYLDAGLFGREERERPAPVQPKVV